MTLTEFLLEAHNGGARNAWISFPGGKAYIRVSKRVLFDSFVDTLDLANVSVVQTQKRQGKFSAFLSELERTAQEENRVLFVESVLNPVLVPYLLKNGYTRLETPSNDFYKNTRTS